MYIEFPLKGRAKKHILRVAKNYAYVNANHLMEWLIYKNMYIYTYIYCTYTHMIKKIMN